MRLSTKRPSRATKRTRSSYRSPTRSGAVTHAGCFYPALSKGRALPFARGALLSKINLQLVALDERDLSIILMVMPGECTSCTGCHEARVQSPPNRTGLMALQRPPSERPEPEYVREIKRYGVLPPNYQLADPIDVYDTDRRYWQSMWHRHSE